MAITIIPGKTRVLGNKHAVGGCYQAQAFGKMLYDGYVPSLGAGQGIDSRVGAEQALGAHQ